MHFETWRVQTFIKPFVENTYVHGSVSSCAIVRASTNLVAWVTLFSTMDFDPCTSNMIESTLHTTHEQYPETNILHNTLTTNQFLRRFYFRLHISLHITHEPGKIRCGVDDSIFRAYSLMRTYFLSFYHAYAHSFFHCIATRTSTWSADVRSYLQSMDWSHELLRLALIYSRPTLFQLENMLNLVVAAE